MDFQGPENVEELMQMMGYHPPPGTCVPGCVMGAHECACGCCLPGLVRSPVLKMVHYFSHQSGALWPVPLALSLPLSH